jgi:hypothetical protein
MEQFSNKVETIVATAYTAGSGALVVASDAGLPATGTFRVRLGNTAGSILRVDSRSGATLTVTAEQDDGDADVGTSADIVLTAGAMNQLKADAIAGSGSGGSGLPGWPTITPLDQSSWSWVNQGGAAISQANGIVLMTAPTDGGTNVRFRKTTAPATPYTVTVLCQPNPIFANTIHGIGFRESATGKLVGISLRTAAGDVRPLISARKQTNPTTFSAQDESGQVFYPGPTFFQITDNGTNIILATSWDGRNFTTRLSEARGTFFTTGPDEYGLWLENFSGADIGMSVLHLAVS